MKTSILSFLTVILLSSGINAQQLKVPIPTEESIRQEHRYRQNPSLLPLNDKKAMRFLTDAAPEMKAYRYGIVFNPLFMSPEMKAAYNNPDAVKLDDSIDLQDAVNSHPSGTVFHLRNGDYYSRNNNTVAINNKDMTFVGRGRNVIIHARFNARRKSGRQQLYNLRFEDYRGSDKQSFVQLGDGRPGAGSIVENCIIDGNGRMDVNITLVTNSRIRFNKINNAKRYSYSNSRDSSFVFAFNRLERNAVGHDSVHYSAGSKIVRSKNGLIYGNYGIDNDGPQCWVDIHNENIEVLKNSFGSKYSIDDPRNVTYRGIFLEYSRKNGNRALGNYVYNINRRQAIQIADCNGKVLYNLLENNQNSLSFVTNGRPQRSSDPFIIDNVLFFNNWIYQKKIGTEDLNSIVRVRVGNSDTIAEASINYAGLRFKNNTYCIPDKNFGFFTYVNRQKTIQGLAGFQSYPFTTNEQTSCGRNSSEAKATEDAILNKFAYTYTPTTRNIHLNLGNTVQQLNLTVYNLAGQKIMTIDKKNVNQLNFSLSDYPKALYILKINADSEVQTLKITN